MAPVPRLRPARTAAADHNQEARADQEAGHTPPQSAVQACSGKISPLQDRSNKRKELATARGASAKRHCPRKELAAETRDRGAAGSLDARRRAMTQRLANRYRRDVQENDDAGAGGFAAFGHQLSPTTLEDESQYDNDCGDSGSPPDEPQGSEEWEDWERRHAIDLQA